MAPASLVPPRVPGNLRGSGLDPSCRPHRAAASDSARSTVGPHVRDCSGRRWAAAVPGGSCGIPADGGWPQFLDGCHAPLLPSRPHHRPPGVTPILTPQRRQSGQHASHMESSLWRKIAEDKAKHARFYERTICSSSNSSSSRSVFYMSLPDWSSSMSFSVVEGRELTLREPTGWPGATGLLGPFPFLEYVLVEAAYCSCLASRTRQPSDHRACVLGSTSLSEKEMAGCYARGAMPGGVAGRTGGCATHAASNNYRRRAACAKSGRAEERTDSPAGTPATRPPRPAGPPAAKAASQPTPTTAPLTAVPARTARPQGEEATRPAGPAATVAARPTGPPAGAEGSAARPPTAVAARPAGPADAVAACPTGLPAAAACRPA